MGAHPIVESKQLAAMRKDKRTPGSIYPERHPCQFLALPFSKAEELECCRAFSVQSVGPAPATSADVSTCFYTGFDAAIDTCCGQQHLPAACYRLRRLQALFFVAHIADEDYAL